MRNQMSSPIVKGLMASVMGFALAAGLSGCNDLQAAMGMQKVSPDEFSIVTKAPLVMPPDYSLRPPQPGATRPIEDLEADAAQNALFGSNSTPVADGVVTAGEYALLTSSGAGGADPNIRNVLATETTAIVQKDESFADQILFWSDGPADPNLSVIDANAESDRLRENQATGRAPTDGATPTISKDRGLF